VTVSNAVESAAVAIHRRTCVAGGSQRHYEVVSPVMRHYPAWELEPAEDFQCWGLFLAPNKRNAIVQAVADEDFRLWVEERRANNEPPFKGLVASLSLCEHGVCWGCNTDGTERTNCPECEEAYQAEDEVGPWLT